MKKHFNDARIKTVLIANRGEIAIRIASTLAEMGFRSVAIYSQDDEAALHHAMADEAVALPDTGPRAYLDMQRLIDIALSRGCQAVHPGYGFLSENARFAEACRAAGLIFIGPRPEVLTLFGSKSLARRHAQAQGIPVLRGTHDVPSLQAARDFMRSLDAGSGVMIKAVAGGGGRGMRKVASEGMLEEAFERCRSEALAAFGCGDLYLEQYLPDARHIEVQILGDGTTITHLGERDCSIQQSYQKVVEITPSPGLSPSLRARILDAAVTLAGSVNYDSLGTFEFLVNGDGDNAEFAFIEANPRLQVEHTITEEVSGVDLVRTQLALANGRSLESLGLTQSQLSPPRGYAIQFRVNMSHGQPHRITAFSPPGGPGVRLDTCAYAGYTPNPNFDALLAKLIIHHPSPDLRDAVQRGYRALCQFDLQGTPTNLPLLRDIAVDPAFQEGRYTTAYLAESRPHSAGIHPQYFMATIAAPQQEAAAAVDPSLSLLSPGDIASPLAGTVIEICVETGQRIAKGQTVAIVTAMKMEHLVDAATDGIVRRILVAGDTMVQPGQVIIETEPCDELPDGEASSQPSADTITPRSDLEDIRALHALTRDEGRPDAVARRHVNGMRTARENLADLCDADSFVEYGALAVAARRREMDMDALRRISPADGFIYGMATINAALFGQARGRCFVASYDYTVFAGTQGYFGHRKHDRMFQLAERARVPVVLYAEGGGGRPTDSDNLGGVNLANPTFWHFARLSGLVPLIGIAAGYCFAGNAALLGCCDVVIATRDASIGLGGPVMIEGAGLGKVAPQAVGPAPQQASNGVVDILVDDEAAATDAARRYLSYFQGPLSSWEAPPQEALRDCIPQRRTRAYDIRKVMETLADRDSVLELRPAFGQGAITALIRLEGRPLGLIANNPAFQAGAIGAEEADKLSRFTRLCNAHGLPILSLCDTPGIMVGPDAERTAVVRHCANMLITGAAMRVPCITIVLRKAYGLGAMAMAGGSFHQSSFLTLAWPTAEFGGMGLEGQVRLGHRKELEEITDPRQRHERFQELVDALYAHGKASNIAPFLSIDDVIDPASTRDCIIAALQTTEAATSVTVEARSFIGAW
ncbi:carbamoyl-phosphate synthase large subunit [Alcaligenaceae bacterium]|nr:carbamoyl-phosphate synthase large subunit [Alcaligenaceae bacterium]